MRKTLLAAAIASELPKPVITLELFKSEDRLRAYGGMRDPGIVTIKMTYQSFFEKANTVARNKSKIDKVWIDELAWVQPTPGQILDDIKKLFDKGVA